MAGRTILSDTQVNLEAGRGGREDRTTGQTDTFLGVLSHFLFLRQAALYRSHLSSWYGHPGAGEGSGQNTVANSAVGANHGVMIIFMPMVL